MHPFYAVHFPNLISEHWQLFHSWATHSWKSVPFSWFKIFFFKKKKKKKKRYVEQDYCFPQSKSPALESFQNTMPLSLSIPQLTE